MKNALKIALDKREYTTLTPVQQQVSNPEYDTADLLVSAQTGSGKTVGFGLAIAPNLLGEAEEFDRADTPLGLVIAPTRELAMQVKRELSWLYAEAGVVMASCVGGMDMRDERRALERGAHIVVATPGRLRDHIMRNSIDLSAIRVVVLDEADEMLDLGFSEDLEMILDATPETRRTLMFSATVSKGIAQLAKKYQTDAQRITTLADKDQHADIEYHAIQVNQHDAENAIINTLRYHEAPNAIVFANTRATVARLTTRLSNRGFSVVCLSGELSQSERSHALQAMRDGRARICVATDVAARGIDLPKLDLVVHAELPSNHETLLHRSGRTGRAGRKGTSVLIVPPNAYRKATRILGSAKLNADWRPAPTADEVLSKDHERMLHDDIWTNEINPNHADMIETLLTQFGAERVAAAFLETYSKHMSAPEDISEFSAKPSKHDGKREPKSHADFGPSTWFKLAKGRNDGVSPGQIVPMLCKAGGITKSDIGAIRIQDKHTFLELRQEAQDGFMSTLGSDPKVEGAPIAALDAAPDLPPAPPRGASGGKPHRGSGGGRGFGGKSDGPRRSDRGDKPARGDKFHPIGAPNDSPKPERAKALPKRFDKPTSPSNPVKERPEGVVTPIKKKPRKSAGPDGGFDPKSPQSSKRAGARKPAGTGLAPKVGKFNSKKNKARRTDGAPSGKGGFSAPKRTK